MASAPDMEGTSEAMDWHYETPPQASSQFVSAHHQQHVAFNSPLPGPSPITATPKYVWNQILQNPATPPQVGSFVVSAANPAVSNGIYTCNYSPFTDSSLGSPTATRTAPGASPANFNATPKLSKDSSTYTSNYSPFTDPPLNFHSPARVMLGAFIDTFSSSPPSATKRTFNEYAEGEVVETQRSCEPGRSNNGGDGAPKYIGQLRRVERSWHESGTINSILMPVICCVAVACSIITFSRSAFRAGRVASNHTGHAIAQRGAVITAQTGAHINTTYIAAVEAGNRAKRVMVTICTRQPRRNRIIPATPVRAPLQTAYHRSVRWADEALDRPGQLASLHTYSPVTEIIGYDVPVLDVDLYPLGKQCQLVDGEMDFENAPTSYTPPSPGDAMDICEEESSSTSPQSTQVHSEVTPLADIHTNTVAQTISSTNTQTQDAVHHSASNTVDYRSPSKNAVPDGSANRIINPPVSEAAAQPMPAASELPAVTPAKTIRFYENPKNGDPVSAFKKFTKGETIDHAVTPSTAGGSIDDSNISSTVDPSILPYDSSMLSPEEVAYISQVTPLRESAANQSAKPAFSVTEEGSPLYIRTGTHRLSNTKLNGKVHEPSHEPKSRGVPLTSAADDYIATRESPMQSSPLRHPDQAISEKANSALLRQASFTSFGRISPQNHEIPHQSSPKNPDQVDIVRPTETDNEQANSQSLATFDSLSNEIPVQLSPNGIPDQVEVVDPITENHDTDNAISSDTTVFHNHDIPSQSSPSAIPDQVEVVMPVGENGTTGNGIDSCAVVHTYQLAQVSSEKLIMDGKISGSTAIAPKMPISRRVRRKSSPATPAKIIAGLERLEVSPDLQVSLRRSSRRTTKKVLEEERLYEEAQARAAAEQACRELEEAEERARKEKEEEAERQKQGVRCVPTEKVILPLSAEWEQKVAEAMQKSDGFELATTTAGVKLTRKDFGTVLPVPGRDRASGWLNDEMVTGYLQAVVEFGLEKAGHARGRIPKYHAFNTFFYTNLRSKGPDSIRRWATKAKIGGKNLESVERVFIPVHEHSHWTLLVVSPIARTIEYFDSLGNPSTTYVHNAKSWLKQELGTAYKDDEWKVLETDSPMQNNGKDCGVFAITTAKMVVLGWDPKASYGAEDMVVQRKRICAELMGGGLRGEFEPRMAF